MQSSVEIIALNTHKISGTKQMNTIVTLEENELTLSDGSVGFLDAEHDPVTFLSIDQVRHLPRSHETDDAVRPFMNV